VLLDTIAGISALAIHDDDATIVAADCVRPKIAVD